MDNKTVELVEEPTLQCPVKTNEARRTSMERLSSNKDSSYLPTKPCYHRLSVDVEAPRAFACGVISEFTGEVHLEASKLMHLQRAAKATA